VSRLTHGLPSNFRAPQIRAMGPPGFKPTALAAVDAYIKAFYLPWDELPRWCQVRPGPAALRLRPRCHACGFRGSVAVAAVP
jgi:hypothetical protein